MDVIGAYSFKGGSGRTTTLANIGASLSKLGKDVCLLDLDIGGPGLSVVLEEGPTKGLIMAGDDSSGENGEHFCIQDYFKSQNPSEFDLENMIIDVSERRTRKSVLWQDLEGDLYLIPARMEIEKKSLVDYRKIETESGERRKRKRKEEIQVLLENLIDRISGHRDGVDYLLIDSSSGYGDDSALTMYVSDLLLIFFRWSRQHLNGTVMTSEFFRHLEGKGREINHEFIANSIPFSLFENEKKENFEKIIEHLEKVVEKDILATLPENDELKWNEKVLVLEEKPENEEIVEGYEKIAREIIEKSEGN